MSTCSRTTQCLSYQNREIFSSTVHRQEIIEDRGEVRAFPQFVQAFRKLGFDPLNAESISLISINNDEPEGCRGARRRKEIRRLAFGVRGLENSATLSH